MVKAHTVPGPAFEFGASPLWFVAPAPPFRDPDELCTVVLKGTFADAAAPYRPYALSGDPETIVFLERLITHGHHFIGLDIEPGSGIPVPIPAVIDRLRQRHQAPGPAAG